MRSPAAIVGMIGIGQLGLPIAINLMRAGYRVVGFRRGEREAFIEAGGVALESPGEVARQADVILMCLPGTEAQESALAGPAGVIAALAHGKTVIELGTYTRDYKLELARRIAQTGARMLEAEVSGSPSMVAERRAALYVGGDAELLASCRPVLAAITEHHFHLGDIGSAVAMKLIANMLVTVHILAAAEAMNLGARAGFDPHRVAEVIRQGAGSSTMFAIRAPMMAARSFTPAPGPFKTLLKYLQLGSEMARELDCSTPLFSTAMPYFMRGLEKGLAEEDAAAVIKLLESESGRATKANAT